ncbi:MAG: ABC transporter substrate-binding protein [Rhodobacteraceae bacterium]|nr:ABC transporter substrate-binding protein [Paracoccaceae bacterium]
MKKRTFLLGSVFAVSTLVAPLAAQANDSVNVVYMRIPPLVHMIYALDHGIFEQHGLDVNLTVVNGGPELMAALASGSGDIGMTAAGIVMTARAGGLPIQVFGTGDYEEPGDFRNWIVADANDGITSLNDLEGKTVGIVAPNSPAELCVRDHMLAAGADPNTVNFVALPFPQLPAALEVGNVDAIMVGDPFHTQIMNSTQVAPVELAEGIIASENEDGRVALGGWFASDEWLADEHNRDIARRYLAAVLQANRELAADRSLVDAIFMRDFGMPEQVAQHVPLDLNTESLVAYPRDYAPTLRAFERTGMIPEGDLSVDDIVVTIAE